MAAHRKDQLTFLTLPTPLPTYIDSTDIHTIPLGAKLKLLSSTVPFKEEYKVHAKKILGYVEVLSEQSLSGVFELKSDDVQELPMRLLGPGHEHIGNRNEMKEKKIEASGREDDKDQWESFITASYCWGKPAKVDEVQDGSPSSLATQKQALPFSPTLYQAFLLERRSLNEGLWVDAICIDQASTSEKQIAVNAMDILYRSARAVIILLDDVTVSLREQDFLADYALEFEACEDEGVLRPHFGERPPYMKRHPVLRGFFDKLVNARWFERAWCAHEMRLSPHHIFLIRCDDDRGAGVRGGTVLRFTGLFMTHLLGLAAPADILSNERLVPLVGVFAEGVLRQFGQQPTTSSYLRVFTDVWRRNAGGNPAIENPVEKRWDANLDKLAIVINTIGLGLSVKKVIDNSARSGKEGVEKRRLPSATEDECCRRFLTLALAAGDLTALCTTGQSLLLVGGQSTWMRWPNFADVGLSENWMSKMRKFDVEVDPGPAAAYVGLDMCFLNGQGNGSYLKWASERKLRICRTFKEGCERRGFSAPNHNYKYNDLKKAGGDQRKVHIRTLVAIMGCGIEWVKWMGENVLEGWDIELLVKSVQRLLDHENLNTEQGKEREPFSVNYMDERGGRKEAELLLDFSRYLMHQALPWKSEGSMTPYEPVCVVSPAREYNREIGQRTIQTALMYAYVPDGGSIVDVVCTIPKALLHDDYSSLFRGWSMIKGEPQEIEVEGKSKSKYHLLGKSRIYGIVFGSASQDGGGDARIQGEFGLEVKATRVYGPREL